MNNPLNSVTGRTFSLLRISCLCLLLSLQSVFSVNLTSGESDNSQTHSKDNLPAWFGEKMSRAVQGTGKWIADNPHKSDNEPFDAYAMEYIWGVGKKSLESRLFAITNNKESGTIWEYREFWHPGEKKVLVYQWGSDGTLGFGEMKPLDISRGKFEVEQTFYDSDGSSWKSRHEAIDKEGERITKSFTYKDGAWEESRTYVWRRTN